MIASFHGAIICAVLATLCWSAIGFPLALRIVSRPIALLMAPMLGWAVHSVLALPLLSLIGTSFYSVVAVAVLPILASVISLVKAEPNKEIESHIYAPVYAVAGAALVALCVMAALLPKESAGGLSLADPIFDHAKVAIIDEISRLGVPPGNPFFGQTGASAKLSYYYLWHFSAAELSMMTGLGGWNADAGLTAFTCFSSLLLMMAFALELSGRKSAPTWVLVVAVSTTFRPYLIYFIGKTATYSLTGYPTGLGGWLFQITWAPQHVAAACCAVMSAYLLFQLVYRQLAFTAVLLSVLSAASFQSSTWIGGIVFPLAAIAIGVFLAFVEQTARWKTISIYVVAAALASLALDARFIVDQANASMLRSEGNPIEFEIRDILSESLSKTSPVLMNFLAYWSIYLVVELGAFYPAGFIMLRRFARDASFPRKEKALVKVFGLIAAVSLFVGCTFISKIGWNNDLAWRAILPAVIVLIVATAAGLSRYLRYLHWAAAAPILLLVFGGAYQGVGDALGNVVAQKQRATSEFEKSRRMWEMVRTHSSATDRVANNPAFLDNMTQWPINISWALLSNRRSCYAGADLALPFAPISRERRADVDELFKNLFSGRGTESDIQTIAGKYDCNLIVLTPFDGAWTSDAFDRSMTYAMIAFEPDSWKIYKKKESERKHASIGKDAE